MADQWLTPFSPLILRTRVAPEVLTRARRAVDAYLADPAWCGAHPETSPVLEEVYQRFELPDELLGGDVGLGFLLEGICNHYLAEALRRADPRQYTGEFRPDGAQALLTVAWLNVSRPGDFVPAHRHSADISGAFYLDIPDGMGGQDGWGGQITFIDGRPAGLVREKLSLSPEAGEVVVFPGWLTHTVHPFRAAGLRRMISFNAVVAAGPGGGRV